MFAGFADGIHADFIDDFVRVRDFSV